MLDYASDIGQHNGGGHGWEPSRAGGHHTYNIRVCVCCLRYRKTNTDTCVMTSHERYAGTTILLCLACSDLEVRSYMDGVGMDERQHDPKAKLRIRVCAYRQQDWKQLHTQLARAIMRATHAQHYARHWCFCPQFISQSQVVGVVEQRRKPVALLQVHVRFITHETKSNYVYRLPFACCWRVHCHSSQNTGYFVSFCTNIGFILFGCCGGV